MFSKPRINIFVSKYNSQFGIFINDPYYLSLRHYIPPKYLRDKNDIECCKVIITTIEHRNGTRSEEHTSELQSRLHLVCRLLLEKKKKENKKKKQT